MTAYEVVWIYGDPRFEDCTVWGPCSRKDAEDMAALYVVGYPERKIVVRRVAE